MSNINSLPVDRQLLLERSWNDKLDTNFRVGDTLVMQQLSSYWTKYNIINKNLPNYLFHLFSVAWLYTMMSNEKTHAKQDMKAKG